LLPFLNNDITLANFQWSGKVYGLSESLVKWFQDYISNRKQIVFINNSESLIGLLKAGVPHGSVLP
jgi:hypothetical protein